MMLRVLTVPHLSMETAVDFDSQNIKRLAKTIDSVQVK